MPEIKAAIFDAYGTLLDVHSAMAKHADRLGPDWERVSQDWRVKQIEYTWVRSLSGEAHYRDFFTLTREALEYVAKLHGIADRDLLDEVLAAYRVLSAYDEVPAMLRALRARGIQRAILSNGEPAMLDDAVRAAKIDDLLDHVLSADELRVYKVAPRVYQMAADRLGVAPEQTAFMSSNPWDAFGAREFGFRVHWINRKRQPDEYDLRATVPELADLSGLPDLLGGPIP